MWHKTLISAPFLGSIPISWVRVFKSELIVQVAWEREVSLHGFKLQQYVLVDNCWHEEPDYIFLLIHSWDYKSKRETWSKSSHQALLLMKKGELLWGVFCLIVAFNFTMDSGVYQNAYMLMRWWWQVGTSLHLVSARALESMFTVSALTIGGQLRYIPDW